MSFICTVYKTLLCRARSTLRNINTEHRLKSCRTSACPSLTLTACDHTHSTFDSNDPRPTCSHTCIQCSRGQRSAIGTWTIKSHSSRIHTMENATFGITEYVESQLDGKRPFDNYRNSVKLRKRTRD